ncbi:Phosphatidylinositol 4-kinase beta [Aphelenchoides besseyi]|nr:Phosphatidylinositol 4-kinase beta [Aphelenchoides besseyi]
MVQPMFGRVPSADCNHSRTGVCSKCILEQTYNLGGSPRAPLKIPTSSPPSAFVTNHNAETPTTSTPILDFFQLRNGASTSTNGQTTYLPNDTQSKQQNSVPPSNVVNQKAAEIFDEQPHTLLNDQSFPRLDSPLHSTASAPSSLNTSPLKSVELKAEEEQSQHPQEDQTDSSTSSVYDSIAFNPTNQATLQMPPSADGESKIMVEKMTTVQYVDETIETAVEVTERWDTKIGGEEVDEELTFTSFASLNRQVHRRITEEEGELDGDEETDRIVVEKVVQVSARVMEKPKESLLRLFESDMFNVSIALHYLCKSVDPAVIMYLGDRLSRFPTVDVDFFIPQLIALYINNTNVASGIHSYIVNRCKESVEFSLQCYLLLEAYGVEQFKTHHKKAQGFFLRETIFNEYICSKQTNQQKTRPELEFVNMLIGIGDRLKDIQPRHEKSKRLIYELFLMNLNLPARVWLPLYADQKSHVLVRIPHTEGCVLNSKDKAPYCIYCEVVEVENVTTAQLPEKAEETIGEADVRASTFAPVVNITTPNGNSLASSFGPPLSPVEEMAAAAVERALSRNHLLPSSSAPVLHETNSFDDDTMHFDRIIDETRSVADSDEVYSQYSDEPDFNDKPVSKFDKIRLRLARLKRRRKPGIAHIADDPSAHAMSEPWEEKQRRIQSASPYGQLPGWRLLPVIIKTGDDLRQELLAYQLLTTLQNIWRDEGVNLYLRPYKILVSSHDSGMIEPIPNACSLHQIKKNLCSKVNLDDAGQPYSPTLLNHFLIQYGSRLSASFQQAQHNFIRSCAAYSLACYFLQVKDRHNGNILLDSEGFLIHIDFGYILSISPKNLGFETSPFKLTLELVDVMGGPNSEMFANFRELVFNGMVAARKHHERIMNIVEVMSNGSQLPCFRANGIAAVRLLRERFHTGYTEQQLKTMVNSLIDQSRDSLTTRLYDNFQYYTNGIF